MTSGEATLKINSEGYKFSSVERSSQTAYFFFINEWKGKSAIIVVSLSSDKAIIYYSEKITK